MITDLEIWTLSRVVQWVKRNTTPRRVSMITASGTVLSVPFIAKAREAKHGGPSSGEAEAGRYQ